jgi:hypothetical protein
MNCLWDMPLSPRRITARIDDDESGNACVQIAVDVTHIGFERQPVGEMSRRDFG